MSTPAVAAGCSRGFGRMQNATDLSAAKLLHDPQRRAKFHSMSFGVLQEFGKSHATKMTNLEVISVCAC